MLVRKIGRRGYSQLMSVSPVDGRYGDKVAPLAGYFSEWALMKYRIVVESQWLLHMLQNKIIPQEPSAPLSQMEKQLSSLVERFDEKGGSQVKIIEKKTNHDLKSVQYYMKNHINNYREHIHFCCTSQDVNNLAYALMLQQALQKVIIPKSTNVVDKVIELSQQWAQYPMLAHTHGQPASPTTLGKQYANFAFRLSLQLSKIKGVSIWGKFNGAVGNYNAHYFTYPSLNWPEITRSFVEDRLGLTFNPYTTQIEPHDSLCRVMGEVGVFNTILIGMCRDSWQYISKGYIKQKAKDGEVGSSTMPHKVNPIDFQNCEGNLGVGNALIDHFRSKLPISRQQRDLSDSTVLRNQGSALGYSLIGYDSLLKGLGKVDANADLMVHQLKDHLQVITEAIQTQLRKVGYPEPYELLKALSRGKAFNQEVLSSLLKELKGKIPEQSWQKISKIRAENYLGRAVDLAKGVRKVCSHLKN